MGSSLTEAGRPPVRLGVLTRTFGLRGGLRCVLDHESVPAIQVPTPCGVGYSAAFARELTLLRCERHAPDLICYFDGVNDPDQAQALADQALFLPADALTYDTPLADPQLIGYELTGENGEQLGIIDGIVATRAHYIWVIRDGDREWMLPAVNEFILDLSHEARTAVVRLIPGLIEENEDGQAGD